MPNTPDAFFSQLLFDSGSNTSWYERSKEIHDRNEEEKKKKTKTDKYVHITLFNHIVFYEIHQSHNRKKKQNDNEGKDHR